MQHYATRWEDVSHRNREGTLVANPGTIAAVPLQALGTVVPSFTTRTESGATTRATPHPGGLLLARYCDNAFTTRPLVTRGTSKMDVLAQAGASRAAIRGRSRGPGVGTSGGSSVTARTGPPLALMNHHFPHSLPTSTLTLTPQTHHALTYHESSTTSGESSSAVMRSVSDALKCWSMASTSA